MIYDSIIVTGSAQVSGSLSVTGGITGSFQGTATTASYVLNAVSSSFATSAAAATTASYVLNAVSASFATSASYAVSASTATNAVTSSHALNAVSSSFATTAVTSSFANAFTVAGTLTATTLVVQTITSSVDFVTGSTRFGSLLANTHAFTGSVGMTGSLAVIGGNVGINTTSPTTKLTIDNSANANTNHIDLIGNSSAGAKGHLGSFGGGTYLTSNYYYASGQNNDTGSLGQGAIIIGTSVTAGSSSISFALSDPGATSPSSKAIILSNGNVGIGTTSPNYANLVISNAAVNSGNNSALAIGRATSLPSSAADYGNIFLFSTDAYAADKGGTISFGSQYGSSGGETRMSGIFGGKENATNGDYSGYLSFYTRLSGNQPTERMRIKSDGTIQIGNYSNSFSDIQLTATTTGYSSVLFGDGSTGTDTYRGYIQYQHNGDYMILATSSTERMRITSDGYLRLAGAGIQFNGDTAAANALNDYEEGAFTPVVEGGTSTGTATYNAQNGLYTKIGRAVSFNLYIDWNTGTGTGQLMVGGLPFTAAAAGIYPSVTIGEISLIALTANNIATSRIQISTNKIHIFDIHFCMNG